MDAPLLSILVGGSLRDPILWIVGAIFGWDASRAVPRTVALLAVAGGIWGAIRAAVYIGLGEDLPPASMLLLIAVCIVLMVGYGMAVREVRWLIGRR